jgi:hypothetical protein
MDAYTKFAKQELKALGYIPLEESQEDGPNKWIQENLMELLSVFKEQGHSGTSALYCVELFKKLALFEPLSPLQGTDDEWVDIGEIYQNIRCSRVFKDKESGDAYDIKGKIFRDATGHYINKNSKVYVTFPYTPKSEIIDLR